MFKKIFSFGLIIFFCLALVTMSSAADEKKAKSASGFTATGTKPLPPSHGRPMARPITFSPGMISGTITKINNANPANVTMEVKSDKDNSMHTFAVMPWTNITKVTNISELKTGDAVKIISRQVDNKDAAMGIIFGDLKKITGPGPMAPAPAVKKPVPPPTMGKN